MRETGRTSERQRFRRIGSHRARESAFETAGFRPLAEGSWSASYPAFPATEAEAWGEAGAPSETALDWEADPRFPEVPANLLKSELWRLV